MLCRRVLGALSTYMVVYNHPAVTTSFESFIRVLHDRVFPSYHHELEREVVGCTTLLDVGCGKDSPIKHFSSRLTRTVGVDVFAPALEQSRGAQIHSEYHQMNVLDIGTAFGEGSFDCVLASDLVEHLDKTDGLRLLDMMERIARKKVIVFTPRGFLTQHEYEHNPWQEHRSGWEVDEMRARGYRVIGINGLKRIWDIGWLWKDRSRAALPVRIIRKALVDVTQLFVRSRPEHAFQMLCVKDVTHSNV
jgi:hypothetical protein